MNLHRYGYLLDTARSHNQEEEEEGIEAQDRMSCLVR